MIENRDLRSTRVASPAGSCRAEHSVPFEVAQPLSIFDYLWTIGDLGSRDGDAVFPPIERGTTARVGFIDEWHLVFAISVRHFTF